MQPSCPGFSMVTRAGFTVMALRQSYILPNRNVQTRREIGEEQSQEHAHHIPFISRGLLTKNSSWQAEQSVLHTNVMSDGDCANFGDKRTDCCVTTTHRLTLPFTPGNFFFYQKHYCRPHPPYSHDFAPCEFSLFPDRR
jgi:hypothetical protein